MKSDQSVMFRAEQKEIVCSSHANSRGRFLKITETVGGRRNAVIVPFAGLVELEKAIEYLRSQQ